MTSGEASRQRMVRLRRILHTLEGRERVTSRDLARWLGTTADTVRKDLAGSGPGAPGAAYDVAELRERVAQLAPLPPPRKTALAGLGELGLALAQEGGPWRFVAGFDGRTNRLETVDLPFSLHPTTEIVPVCLRLGIEEAVLAVAPADVQRIAERFVQAGVRHLVNYTPTALRVDRHRVEVVEMGG